MLIAGGKMNFTEATKRDAEEKFQQLNAGTAPSPITPPELDSFSQFEQKSKKYHDHIYLSPFFHKEIGELEKINYDTIKAKIIF